MTFRVASAHEEGGERVYAVSTSEIVGDAAGRVSGLRLHQVVMGESGFEKVEGTDRELPAQLVLLAMGFLGPQGPGVVEQLGVELDARSNVARDAAYMTSVPGVFVAGGRRARPVADRLGDRRGPLGGGGCRCVADRRHVGAAAADQPDRPTLMV